MRKVHIVVTGGVQGVGYRAWCERAAQVRRLAGWVRNRADGSVEAVLAGDDDEVEDMIAACQRGPAAAAVSDVAVSDFTGDTGNGFQVLPTA